MQDKTQLKKKKNIRCIQRRRHSQYTYPGRYWSIGIGRKTSRVSCTWYTNCLEKGPKTETETNQVVNASCRRLFHDKAHGIDSSPFPSSVSTSWPCFLARPCSSGPLLWLHIPRRKAHVLAIASLRTHRHPHILPSIPPRRALLRAVPEYLRRTVSVAVAIAVNSGTRRPWPPA